MGSLNRVILIGNLGRDPEVKYLPSGQAVANFSVATNDNYQDKDGNKQERTEWHRVALFGKLAEIAGQYLSKGKQVYIEGRLQTREWTSQDGQKHKTTDIVGQSMLMLGGKGESAPAPDASSQGADDSQPPPGDDIPF